MRSCVDWSQAEGVRILAQQDGGPYVVGVPCADVLGRRRLLQVAIDGAGHVNLTAPPGETGVLISEQLDELIAALTRAAGDAARSRPRDLGAPRS